MTVETRPCPKCGRPLTDKNGVSYRAGQLVRKPIPDGYKPAAWDEIIDGYLLGETGQDDFNEELEIACGAGIHICDQSWEITHDVDGMPLLEPIPAPPVPPEPAVNPEMLRSKAAAYRNPWEYKNWKASFNMDSAPVKRTWSKRMSGSIGLIISDQALDEPFAWEVYRVEEGSDRTLATGDSDTFEGAEQAAYNAWKAAIAGDAIVEGGWVVIGRDEWRKVLGERWRLEAKDYGPMCGARWELQGLGVDGTWGLYHEDEHDDGASAKAEADEWVSQADLSSYDLGDDRVAK